MEVLVNKLVKIFLQVFLGCMFLSFVLKINTFSIGIVFLFLSLILIFKYKLFDEFLSFSKTEKFKLLLDFFVEVLFNFWILGFILIAGYLSFFKAILSPALFVMSVFALFGLRICLKKYRYFIVFMLYFFGFYFFKGLL